MVEKKRTLLNVLNNTTDVASHSNVKVSSRNVIEKHKQSTKESAGKDKIKKKLLNSRIFQSMGQKTQYLLESDGS